MELSAVILDGIPVPVPTRENLINIKRLSSRPQDIIDIEALQAADEA
ncbi:MAG: hypothetical protein N3B18_01280 [Desulfobacterota bacterium]|nr:hypothetical protein [Thermodesulfobacteriota bacterium]